MHFNWLRLDHDPALLTEPRLHLHYAVQTLAAFGDSILAKRADWSHTSMSYDPEQNAFYSEPLSWQGNDLHTVLKLTGLDLEVQNGQQDCLARTSLYGQSLSAVIEWLKTALKAQGVDAKALHLPQYPGFPEHPLAKGAPFAREHEGGIRELGRYYSNTLFVLQEYLAQKPGPAPAVRVWPHHFDMAALITIKEPSETGGEDGSSVGLGMTPGDSSYSSPYWYVTPWPYFAKEKLKVLPAGTWNTEGWLGALLQAVEIMPANAEQSQIVRNFIRSAADVCLEILDSNNTVVNVQ